MAGKRQHFIPRFLQKGFASHSIGEEVFTWTYRKGAKPFNSNTKNVGVESFFYSENGDMELDETISVAEGDFAQLIDSIRSKNVVGKRDKEDLAKFFAHLEVRTRHLRQSFFTTGNTILNKMLEHLSDPGFCEQFIRRSIANDPSLIINSFSKELRKRGISQKVLPHLIRLIKPMIELKMPNILSDMSFLIAYLKEEMPGRLERASKTGHIKALNFELSPVARFQRYEKLNYKVVNSEDNSLILGDSALVFHVRGDRSFKPILENKDELIALLLPIGPKQLIIGSSETYVPDFSELHGVVPACSLEYFIAHEYSTENEQLIEKISDNSFMLTGPQMDELIWNAMKKKPSGNNNELDTKQLSASARNQGGHVKPI